MTIIFQNLFPKNPAYGGPYNYTQELYAKSIRWGIMSRNDVLE